MYANVAQIQSELLLISYYKLNFIVFAQKHNKYKIWYDM